MGNGIGIDLGTSNSVMAVVEGSLPTVVPNADGDRVTPSVVGFDPNTHQILIGTPARRQAVTNPQDTVFSINRFVGQRFNDPDIRKDLKFAPYEVCPANDGSILVRLGGKWYSPQKILAMILRKLKRDAEAYMGRPVTHAVITVPAYFNALQRQDTREACHIAGLNVSRFINAPTAASLAYGLDKEEFEKILVFDLGGGTFDVSILEVGENLFQVLSTSGDTKLGGDDWDYRIMDYLAREFKKETGIDLSADRVAIQRLKDAAEKAKIDLSQLNTTGINLPFITADKDGQPKHLDITFSRAKFEELTKDLLQRALSSIEESLKAAKPTALSKGDIKKVILVGGATRMPMVQKIVIDYFGMEPYKNINPDECVALGAAIQGGVLSGEVKDVLLLDVIPLPLSIETSAGVATSLIQRNTTIPTKVKQIFSTTADNQTSVDIKVYQGEQQMTLDNILLGQFRLGGILPAPKGVPEIEVTFFIDVNGILNVSAKDIATGRDNNVSIITPKGVTPIGSRYYQTSIVGQRQTVESVQAPQVPNEDEYVTHLQNSGETHGFVDFIEGELGVSFDYPSGWNIEYSKNRDKLMIFPPNVKLLKDHWWSKRVYSIGITMMVMAGGKEENQTFYQKFVNNILLEAPSSNLLWTKNFNLSSGEDSLEYSYDFMKGRYPFRVIAVCANKGRKTFSLDCSVLKSDFKRFEKTIHKVVTSLRFLE